MSVEAVPVGRIGPGQAVRNTLTITRRDLLHIKSDPEQLVGMTVQPLMFLLLFVYVFGGAIAGSSSEYLQFALPGLIIQGVAFTGFTTALGLNIDFKNGIVDRFRSLPIARSAVIGGRILSDSVRVVWSVVIMMIFGVILGFDFTGGVAGGVGALLVASAFGITMCWPMGYIGIIAKAPESVNTYGFLLILPLTFASSVFADPDTMPAGLRAFVNVNPISKVVDGTRALMLGGPVAESLIPAILWMLAITVVFAPLAIVRYRRRV